MIYWNRINLNKRLNLKKLIIEDLLILYQFLFMTKNFLISIFLIKIIDVVIRCLIQYKWFVWKVNVKDIKNAFNFILFKIIWK